MKHNKTNSETLHGSPKKIALINDFSGFGRCSLTVEIPVISYLGVQCCCLPTAVLSNHTGFDTYFFDDYTDKMPKYIEKWKELSLSFDGILTGFLGSERQIETVSRFISDFKKENTTVIVDPVMGDHGKMYDTYTPQMCERMRELVGLAHIICPNLTEACTLTKTPYKSSGWKKSELFEIARALENMGAEKIVITGIETKQSIGNLVHIRGGEPKIFYSRKTGKTRSGSGDVFSSVIAADALCGVDFKASVKRAADFLKKCIAVSEKNRVPDEEGVAFEVVLSELKKY
ncbi:MAG: pyridoxamine kinase [Oscillospiraceae bacterium]